MGLNKMDSFTLFVPLIKVLRNIYINIAQANNKTAETYQQQFIYSFANKTATCYIQKMKLTLSIRAQIYQFSILFCTKQAVEKKRNLFAMY